MADDTKKGQYQRHGSGLLQSWAPRYLRSEILAALWLPGEPVSDDRFNILRVTQWLQHCHFLKVVFASRNQLTIPRIRSASKEDPPRECISITERPITAAGLVKRVNN